ncbi:hypothetical protein [Pelomonas sp. Root1217]|uniref:hypothetical protein n=1 Tax=Pelomonas sp. Root1217 TaxID=1736430 RepID=UPI000B290D76|nr:hypothetical protein [Pelomonas sp. Root1217]
MTCISPHLTDFIRGVAASCQQLGFEEPTELNTSFAGGHCRPGEPKTVVTTPPLVASPVRAMSL